MLLVEAYSGAGRAADAIEWLEEAAATIRGCCRRSPNFYERERRWTDAAAAYEQALRDATPRTANPTPHRAYASALLGAAAARTGKRPRRAAGGGRRQRDRRARARALLSQAERRPGDYPAAEAPRAA